MTHHSPRAPLAALLFLVCLGPLLLAEPRLTPDPRLPVEAREPPVMDATVFARAMLVSSGAPDVVVERELVRLEGLAAVPESELLKRDLARIK